MATTTTINPTSDTRMFENSPDTNYGSAALVKIGYATGTGKMDNSVFRFDVSSYNAEDIVSAVFTLKVATEWGSTARELILARCTKEWVDTECTWNVYKDSTAWTAGGGVDDTALTEPTYSATVGDSSGDIVVDITKLVVDAIKRRAGNLNFIIYMQSTPASTAIATYHSVNATTPSNRPALAMTVADTIVWSGVVDDGDADNLLNWNNITSVGNTLPTNNDYVYFNSGSVDVTEGTISCDSMFISEGYTGNIGSTSTQIIIRSDGDRSIDADKKLVINKGEGLFSLKAYTLTSQSVYISKCQENCKYEGVVSYNCYVSGTNANLEIVGESNLVATGTKTGTKNITTSGTVTTIIAFNTKLTVSNGCNDFTLGDGSRMNVTSGDIAQRGSSYITDNSYVDFRGGEIGADTHIFSGTLSFKNNENPSITTEDIYLWKNGYFDSRTNVGAWNDTASPSIDCRGGGKFVVDVGRTLTIAN
jgi:hypothetical protein